MKKALTKILPVYRSQEARAQGGRPDAAFRRARGGTL